MYLCTNLLAQRLLVMYLQEDNYILLFLIVLKSDVSVTGIFLVVL